MGVILDQLRDAIEQCGKSRYEISKESGIDQAQLSRLMRGEGGLGVARIEKLAECLQLEISIRPKRIRKVK